MDPQVTSMLGIVDRLRLGVQIEDQR
jgi:hypothetical protein